jgi:hypothetical protein
VNRVIITISLFCIIALSCTDKGKTNVPIKSNIISDTTKPKEKTRPYVGVVYSEEGIKIYADTTIDKQKIYYVSRKFEPYISFGDYKVKIEHVEARLDLNSHKLGRSFRTAIRSDYDNDKALFAGHYTLASWGCGAPCRMSVIVDRRTGKIYDSPDAEFGYQFKADSRLLVVNPPDSLVYYDNCSYCKPEIYILNEETKRFELKKAGLE